MRIKLISIITYIALVFFLTDCGSSGKKEKMVEGRWYTQSQVSSGKQVFKKNCAPCHGKNADKTKKWKKLLPNGSYPPPPLNGTAHASHHPMKALLSTINNGGIPFGGKMPPFKNKLTEEEKLTAIAYFQSFWSKEIYEGWEQRNRS